MVDAPDGLDLGGLAVGAPVLPVLEVSAVPLALHDVLLAPVAGVLVADEAGGGRMEREGLGKRWCLTHTTTTITTTTTYSVLNCTSRQNT